MDQADIRGAIVDDEGKNRSVGPPRDLTRAGWIFCAIALLVATWGGIYLIFKAAAGIVAGVG